jgi:hypothetical protein
MSTADLYLTVRMLLNLFLQKLSFPACFDSWRLPKSHPCGL